jgi:protein SHQ1
VVYHCHYSLTSYFLAAENDWQLPQEIQADQQTTTPALQQSYGFLNLHSGYFKHVTHTENEVNELGSGAETIKPAERNKLRRSHEDKKFDPEHYMSVVEAVCVCGWDQC